MNRILIIGRNHELARDVFSRTACRSNPLGSSHSQETGQAVFYSGMKPDSAPGGSRHDTKTRAHLLSLGFLAVNRPQAPSTPSSPKLGATRIFVDIVVLFGIGLAVVALMVWAAV